MKFYFQLVEYIVLRMLRRFVFTYSFLLRFGRFIPYFRVNVNQDMPEELVERYIRYMRDLNRRDDDWSEARILEVGAGTTNAVGLLLAHRLGCKVDVFDPYVQFDQEQTNKCIAHFKMHDETVNRVRRVQRLEGKYDFILSNSVLEHVKDIDQFFIDTKEVLKENGAMVHFVDYRDHFFKYPYFFLMFSKRTWDTFLNPGDLYRWRLDNHLSAIEQGKLKYEIHESEIMNNEAEYIEKRIQPYFRKMQFWNVSNVALVVQKEEKFV
jgi:2-polyprenyl-3-methyl-5-hydroxy-6-metoxy-1,4-benzoquinol methylase